jgi:hypothetical protein
VAQISEDQILKMFRDFGLETDADRERLRALAALAGAEYPVYSFIKLDDRTEGHRTGEQDGKLA